jgi:hypothetical protein
MAELSLTEKIFLFEIYLSVAFWEYISFQSKTVGIKYNEGYGYFSLIQWIAIGAGLIAIFGLKIGIIIFFLCLLFLQYLCHFTLGLVLHEISKLNKDIPLAIFAVNVWILVVMTIYIIFFN